MGKEWVEREGKLKRNERKERKQENAEIGTRAHCAATFNGR